METQKLTDRSYKYAKDIVKFIFDLPKNYNLQPITNQLLRAATSVSANIYEAQGAYSRKEFANFYQISFKSAIETKFWLRLLADTTNINKLKITEFIHETENMTNILAASLITLKKKLKTKK